MNKANWYHDALQDLRVTKMGLGPLGRSFGDILFLARSGAEILVTDFRSGDDIDISINSIKKKLTPSQFKKISWTLGRHLKKDFKNADLVLRASAVPLESEYIKAAHSKGVAVRSSASWICELVKQHFENVIIIGVTGSKGKSTVTAMIESLLRESGMKYHLAGNIRGVANLPVLEKVQEGDVILMELDSWQLQGFAEARISPDISVFTNFFPDHMDYYKGDMKAYFKDKANIFRYQKEPNCYVSPQAKQAIKEYGRSSDLEKTRSITTGRLPDYKYQVLGDHMLQNLALAHQVAVKLEISEAKIKKGLTAFKPVEGRMQYLGQTDGVHFYNDNNSTTPESTILSLQSIRKKHPDQEIIWLAGGARKDTDYSLLGARATRAIDHALFFRGEGTNDMVEFFPKNFSDYVRVDSMDAAFAYIARTAKKTDVVVLSPAAASFGMFTNEYDRNDQFLKAVKKFSRNS